MGFQLSNEDGADPSGSERDSAAASTRPGASVGFQDDDFDPAAEDTVFIANQYQNMTPIDATATDSGSSGASYITERENFPPVLMFLGVFLQLIAVGSLTQLWKGGTPTPGSILPCTIISWIGTILYIVDAVIVYKKKMAGASLIAWALVFNYVYFFKRLKASNISGVFALLIIVVQLAVTGLSVNTMLKSELLAMGIEVNETGLQGAAKANTGISLLSLHYLYFTTMPGEYYYDQLVAYNVKDPIYSYVEAADSDPDVLRVQGTTTLRGIEEPITIDFNYNTTDFYSITIGSTIYKGDENLFDVLYNMARRTPSGPGSQGTVSY